MIEEFLKNAVQETREAIIDLYQESVSPACPNTIFIGRCGTAQDLLRDHFSQVNVGADQYFATQSLKNWKEGHVAAIVRNYDEHYLVDPTFRQFKAVKDNQSPIHLLNKWTEGPSLAQTLTEDGVIKLTPHIADIYLRSFCGGKRQSILNSAEKAMHFLKKPPHYEPHLIVRPRMEKKLAPAPS